MDTGEYASCDGLGLADLVARGEVTPKELVECAYEAIARTNETLNFIVGLTPDEAERCLEKLPDGTRFGGIPTLLKDIGPKAAGVLQEAGSGLARGIVAQADSEIVRRWRRAGLVFLGRTNTPELGSALTTEPRANGPTRNPWDVRRSAGGSSGGAAAAVACGAVPLAMGGDSGGSLRVPCHCCGLFGMKPSRGRNPVGPESGETNSGFTVAHVLTRSVRDSAAVLDLTAGPDAGCRYFCPPPAKSFLECTREAPAKLRMAWSNHNCFGGTVDSEVSLATERAAKLCMEMGHIVEEATPPIDGEEMLDVFDTVWSANMNHAICAIAARTGRTPGEDNLEAWSLMFMKRGAAISADEYLTGLDRANALARRVGAFFEKYDVLVTPVFSTTAPLLGTIRTDEYAADVRQLCLNVFRTGAFTAQYNLTGQPAMSVPLYQSASGLPIGVQVVARYGEESVLFSLAGELERALPWACRRPPVSAFG